MQQEAPAGTPWWAWLVLLVLIFFVLPMYNVWSGQRKQEREAKSQSAQLARVDHQVSNEHQTNLRDDVDRATHEAGRAAVAAEKALEALARIEQFNGETRRDIGGLREEQRELGRNLRSVSDRIDGEIEERRKEIREVRQKQEAVETIARRHIGGEPS